MAATCKDCGGVIQWEQEAGSRICTQCGTLEDASQQVLDSHLEGSHDGTREHPFLGPQQSVTTLKSLRKPGWDLVGQGKDARDRRNMLAMHEFVTSIGRRLCCPGQINRAMNIFATVMERGKYRWGRRARIMAGAALAIAVREAQKSDPLRDIGLFIGESTTSVARAFTLAVTLLGFEIASVDPSTHIATLVSYFCSILQSDGPTLPIKLRVTLESLRTRLPSIQRIAVLLSALFSRIDTFSHVAVPPTACALFLLALEAEFGAALPHSTEFASILGARYQVAGSTIQSRYKLAYDIVEDWIRDVPWLKSHETRIVRGVRGLRKVSKISKRDVVARGLKDAVEFQEEIWQKKVDAQHRPQLVLEDEDQENASIGSLPRPRPFAVDRDMKRKDYDQSEAEAAVRALYPWKKRRRTTPGAIDQACTYLLDPLSSTSSVTSTRSSTPIMAPGTPSSEPTTLFSHLLTAHPMEVTLHAPPTRLQMLASERGGSSEHHIQDEELFEDGELDGFMRTENEMALVRKTVEWHEAEVIHTRTTIAGRVTVPRPQKEKAAKGRERINTDVLKRLLGDPTAMTDLDDRRSVQHNEEWDSQLMGETDFDEPEKDDDIDVDKLNWEPVTSGLSMLDDADWYEF